MDGHWGGGGGADPIQGYFGAMSEDFVLLASCASLDILGDPVVHPWPGEMVPGLLDHLVLAQMPCSGMVIYQCHEVTLSGLRDPANC
jgi:hypothetical protein